MHIHKSKQVVRFKRTNENIQKNMKKEGDWMVWDDFLGVLGDKLMISVILVAKKLRN